MRILVRTSKWAIWARRFGSFALPVAVIPVFMHRERLIDSETFNFIEVAAIALAVFALFLALGAFVRLWLTGDRGWGRATLGLVFSLICLGPLAVGIITALRFPPVTDVSTDLGDPPVLISGLEPILPFPGLGDAIRRTFPNAQTRNYPLEPAQVFALAGALAQARGWDVRLRRAPQTPLDEGQLNAIAMTLLGWREEVSLRIRGDAQGSIVDMRSASLSGIHDLGGNGQRIEEFLVALDNEVTVMMRDMPAVVQSAPDEPAG